MSGITKTMLMIWGWGCKGFKKKQSMLEIQNQIIKTKYPGWESWENLDGVSYKKLSYTSEIIKDKPTSKHLDNILVGGLKSKELLTGQHYY